MKEKRKVDFGGNKEFQLCKLKPGSNNDYYKCGQDKSPKAIFDLIKRGTYELEFGDGVVERLNHYRRNRGKPEFTPEGKLVSLVEQK